MSSSEQQVEQLAQGKISDDSECGTENCARTPYIDPYFVVEKIKILTNIIESKNILESSPEAVRLASEKLIETIKLI